MGNCDLPRPGTAAVQSAPCVSPSAPEAGTTALELPAVGELAYDARHDRVGEVMELRRTYSVLRPCGGGREWEVPLGYLHKADRAEQLRARVAELNASSRWNL